MIGVCLTRNKKNFTMKKLLFICLSVSLIIGCRSIGPSRVHIDSATYNNIVLKTEQEQLLMNIVRLRYLEGNEYTKISAITASYSMSETLGGNVATTSTPPNVLTSLSSSISPSITYTDSPTISYTPLSSMEFTKSLMAPISMINFLLLAQGDKYDYRMLFSLFIEDIGEVAANLLNIGGENHLTPQYKTYIETMGLLSKLYRRGAFQVPRAITYEGKLGVLLRFHTHFTKTPDAIKLKKLLLVPLNARDIVFMEHSVLEVLEEKNGVIGFGNPKSEIKNIVYIRFRSLLSIMATLSRGLHVPKQDICDHLTKELVESDASIDEWRKQTNDFLNIYASEREPRENVFIKVYLHGHWFYIKASDLASKDTFAAIRQLFILTSADTSGSNTPILTIPVSARS